MKKGFTLIELMIVVAIIAIIAAIAIPNLLRSRMAANETAAVAACKAFCTAEDIYRRTDYNKDGVLEYSQKLSGANRAAADRRGLDLVGRDDLGEDVRLDLSGQLFGRDSIQHAIGLELRGGGGPVELSRSPCLRQIAEERPATVRVDVDAASEVASDRVEEPLGVSLASELSRALRTTRVLAPPGPIAPVPPLVDARHRPLHRLQRPFSVLKKSSALRTVTGHRGHWR